MMRDAQSRGYSPQDLELAVLKARQLAREYECLTPSDNPDTWTRFRDHCLMFVIYDAQTLATHAEAESGL